MLSAFALFLAYKLASGGLERLRAQAVAALVAAQTPVEDKPRQRGNAQRKGKHPREQLPAEAAQQFYREVRDEPGGQRGKEQQLDGSVKDARWISRETNQRAHQLLRQALAVAEPERQRPQQHQKRREDDGHHQHQRQVEQEIDRRRANEQGEGDHPEEQVPPAAGAGGADQDVQQDVFRQRQVAVQRATVDDRCQARRAAKDAGCQAKACRRCGPQDDDVAVDPAMHDRIAPEEEPPEAHPQPVIQRHADDLAPESGAIFHCGLQVGGEIAAQKTQIASHLQPPLILTRRTASR